jgi:hypothetical protein
MFFLTRSWSLRTAHRRLPVEVVVVVVVDICDVVAIGA